MNRNLPQTGAIGKGSTSSYGPTVGTVTNQIQYGSMNIAHGAHPSSRSHQIPPERTLNSRPSKFDRVEVTSPVLRRNSVQRALTDNTTIRTRLSSQDRTSLLSHKPYTNGVINESSHDHPPIKSKSPTQSSVSNSYMIPVDYPSAFVISIESKLMHGGLTGLANLGNTCFMNSVLQCLSNTKPLLLFCFDDNLESSLNSSTTSVMKGVLMKEFATLIRRMWSSTESRSIVSPSQFKNQIARFAPRFTGYYEQDSQEFLRYLLQGLHEDVNRVKKKSTPTKIDEKAEEQMHEKNRAKLSWDRYLSTDNSMIVEIFVGQLKSTLECCYCGYQSITFDPFWDLSVPLPRNKSTSTLQQCIQLFMSKEELDGNEKAMCAKCKQKRRCTKKFSIQKCPEILVLHLKRFSQSRGRTKLNTMIDFPITDLRLNDLTDVLSESYEGPAPVYSLFGVSNHSGTPYTGHYTAACKHPFQSKWHEFNDSSVYQLSQPSRIISPDAYVLFYERVR